MNIKKRIPKFLSVLLSFTMAFGNIIPAYATENTNGNSTTVIDGENISTEERNLEDITVTYKQASSFFVTIPKTIVLDGWKQSTYSVKVSGDIGSEQCVYVAPVDMIDKTENIDFYMKDQATENAKDDVVANVTHKKSHWNAAEVAGSFKQDDNVVSAPGLTAGAWRGIFQMEIKLETHVTHKHNYVAVITKEPTCTEKGEKTYTCDCGDSYTEEIPAKGHHFVDGTCEGCGDVNLVSTTIFSERALTSRTTDSGYGHYDKTSLSGKYSPDIEIAENMKEGEYLLLDWCTGIPNGHFAQSDGINGSSMLQKYDEETGTWKTIYSYNLLYNTIATNMDKFQEGYYKAGYGYGIRRKFQLEKGTYRVYGSFSAQRSCASSSAHYYYSYSITAILNQIGNENINGNS